MITVTLTPDEIFTAAVHGVFRRIKKHEGDREDREQKERSIWDNEIEGSCAELAWAKYHEEYWTGLSKLRGSDTKSAEVRWTRHEHGGLIIYRKDKNQDIFVLAKGFAPTITFVGWISGEDARKNAADSGFGPKLLDSSFLNPFDPV